LLAYDDCHIFTHTDTYIIPVAINVASSILVILLGLPLLQGYFFEWIKRSKNAELLNFWDMGYGQSVGVLYGSQEVPLDKDSDPSRALSVFTAKSYNRIQTLVNSELRYHTDLNFVDARDRDADVDFWKQVLGGNIVVIGGDLSFPILPHLWTAIGAEYYQDCVTDPNNRVIKNLKGLVGYNSRLSSEGLPEADSCLVTRVRPSGGKESDGATIFISGNYGVGTYAAVETLCRANFVVGKHQMRDVTQFAVTVDGIQNGRTFSSNDVRIISIWDRDLNVDQWHNAISVATESLAAEQAQ